MTSERESLFQGARLRVAYADYWIHRRLNGIQPMRFSQFKKSNPLAKRLGIGTRS